MAGGSNPRPDDLIRREADPLAIPYHPEPAALTASLLCIEFSRAMQYRPANMIHENLTHSIEDLSARMIAIRDSL